MFLLLIAINFFLQGGFFSKNGQPQDLQHVFKYVSSHCIFTFTKVKVRTTEEILSGLSNCEVWEVDTS